MGLTNTEEESIITTLRVCNIISLLGSLSIIVIYIGYKSLRIFSFRLIFLMSMADTIRGIGFELSPKDHSSCIIQGLLTNFGSLSSIIWSSIIAYSMFSKIVLENEEILEYTKTIMFCGYGLPLIMSLLPLSTHSIGKAEGWCWFRNDSYQYLWGIGCFFVILIVSIIFNCYCYYRVIKEVNYDLGVLSESPHEVFYKRIFFNRLNYYPMVLVVCYVPILAMRIYEITNEDSVFWLTMFSAITTSMVGLFNALVYGFTDRVKDTIFSTCRKRKNSVIYASLPDDLGINNSFMSNIQ